MADDVLQISEKKAEYYESIKNRNPIKDVNKL